MTQHKKVGPEERFNFGKNWQSFAQKIDVARIHEAKRSLSTMLKDFDFHGKTFIDVGCGSGLFSLAARQLGARVYSFDYDHDSVTCTYQLKNTFLQNDADWHIEHGSILDDEYLTALGTFDVVYSWGVLHHTGDMQKALHNVDKLVKPGGVLYIAIYNDQGRRSRNWLRLKKLYNISPGIIRLFLVVAVAVALESKRALVKLLMLHNPLPFTDWKNKKKDRGMSVWNDYVDLVGGYPYEVASLERIFYFYRKKNYNLCQLKTCGGGYGCNEYVFKKLG